MDRQLHEKARQKADICKLFGNANRILIIRVLANREMTVSDIAEQINASRQNTSQHLRLMKDRGILIARREGQLVYYRLNEQIPAGNCAILDCAFRRSQPGDDQAA